jgi:hypothetical protein
MSALKLRVLAMFESLSNCIKAHESKPIDVIDIMSWFSIDIMGGV